MPDPVRLDGSQGEGGGQILRTATMLSVLTQRPFEITNIRANRPKPGLRPQHAGVLRFLAGITGGSAEGAEVGSTEVQFTPGPPVNGGFEYDMGTAGSITLFLQAVLPVFLVQRGKTELIIKGGTDVPYAPTMDWYTGVYIPYIAPLVARLEISADRRGFYPAGGGEVHLTIENPGGPEDPTDLEALRKHVMERMDYKRTKQGNWVRTDVVSLASQGLRDEEIAERQANTAGHRIRRRLRSAPTEHTDYVGAHSVGATVTVRLADDLGNVLACDRLLERDAEPERVGRDAADHVLEDMETGATVDRYMADQAVPWIALGAPAVKVPRVTGHLETNIATCKQFLGDDAIRLDGLTLKGR